MHNQCLSACTRAFRLSPTASLCLEFGIVPLTYLHDIVSLMHLFKTQVQPESPTYRAVLGDPHELNPAGERI